jgi:hypothetical protein
VNLIEPLISVFYMAHKRLSSLAALKHFAQLLNHPKMLGIPVFLPTSKAATAGFHSYSLACSLNLPKDLPWQSH